MNLREQIRNPNPSRQVRLKAFLLECEVEYQALADALGISKGALCDVFSGRRPVPKHIARLIELGIPAELLPEPPAPRHKPRRPAPDPEVEATGAGFLSKLKKAVGL